MGPGYGYGWVMAAAYRQPVSAPGLAIREFTHSDPLATFATSSVSRLLMA
jgi:hypothetical protein